VFDFARNAVIEQELRGGGRLRIPDINFPWIGLSARANLDSQNARADPPIRDGSARVNEGRTFRRAIRE